MSSLKKNYILNLFYRIVSILFPLFSAPYLSRVIGAEGIGIFSYTNSILVYFMLFAEMGCAYYARVEVAKIRDSKKKISTFFIEIQLIRFVTYFLCLVGWLAYTFISKEYLTYKLILAIILFSSFFDISWIYIGLEMFPRMIARNLSVRVLSFISIFIFVKSSDDIANYFLIYALGEFLGNISYWFKVNNLISLKDFYTIKPIRHLKSIWIYFLPSIATTIYSVLDKSMLKNITCDVSQNGYYDQAVKICNIPMTLIVSMDAVVGARMSYLFAKNEIDEIKNRLFTSLKFVLFLGVPMVMGLQVIAPRFVIWYLGADFEPAVRLIQIYAPIILCIGINNFLSEQYLSPAGKRKQSAVIVVISAIMNFVLNLIFIPKIGANGAALTSIVSEGFIAISYVIMARKMLPIKKYIIGGWKYVFSTIIMVIVILVVSKNWGYSIICSMGQVFLGTCVYFGVLVVLKDELFMTQVSSILKKIMRK